MVPTLIIPRAKHENILAALFRAALVLTLALFPVVAANAQTAGPQGSRLIGTIQSENFTGAVFSDAKGEQTFYRVFDKLPDGSRIIAVHSDSISLKGPDGMSYDMYSAHDRTASPAANAAVPAKPEVPADQSGPASLQTDITKKPYSQERQQLRRGRANTEDE